MTPLRQRMINDMTVRGLPTVAAVLGHASLTTTAIYTTAIGAEARALVSRVWA